MTDITLTQGAVDALDNLPTQLDRDTTVNITSSRAGWTIGSHIGKGTLTFLGGWTATTVTTGYNAGTAGAGTTSTSLVKPSGGSNWTASDLIGKMVYISSGGGAGEVRPIRANTTTAATIDAITGLDTTSVFIICYPSYSITSDITIDGCLAPVVLRGLTLDGGDLITSENRRVTLDGCYLTGGDWLSEYDGRVTLKNCVIKNTHKFYATEASRAVEVEACYLNDGQVKIDGTGFASIQGEAKSCTANAFYLANIRHAQVNCLASNNSVTPFYLESCQFLEAIGTDKLTGSSNTGYGISVNTAGRYRLIGSTVTGASGDIDFDGELLTWANLASSTYGVAQKHGSTLVAESGEAKSIEYKSKTFLETVEVSGRLLTYGYHNMSQVTGLTATGTVYGDALQLTQYVYNRFDTVAAGTGAKMTNGAVIPGVLCIIHNNGANALTLYAYTGGTIDGGASISVAAGTNVTLISSSNDGLSWVTI